LSITTLSEIDSLLAVSGRIGADPMLVQAATGNTSVKTDGVLWIKASGKWLAHAGQDEILVPVSLAETRRRVENNLDPAGQTAIVNGQTLGTSVETAMHAAIPHRVILHVHSVNVIAWAVRADGEAALKSRLAGIDWQWIPYLPSGLPLAGAIQAAVARAPQTKVFILANHGLVVCGDSPESAEHLLREVEARVAITPHSLPEPNWDELQTIADRIGWRVPANPAVHMFGACPRARAVVEGGILYPCQAIFLTHHVPVFSRHVTASDVTDVAAPWLVIEGVGTLVRQRQNPVEGLTLAGLAQVVLRLPEGAPLAYLSAKEVQDLLCADVYHYRERVEGNSSDRMPFPQRSSQDGVAAELR
jgi:rhamnose utilization protein RhaD (predicted bifunctional aldolase and dehydrogenase)